LTLRVEHVMGMPVVVDVRDADVGDEAIDAAFAWLRHVDAVFSTFRPESEISLVRRGAIDMDDASEEVAWVLARCEELRAETGGYFDARFGGSLDPSGLVKGWSVDRAAAILEAAGARNYAVSAGGDIRLAGGALPDEAWRVGIQHPTERLAVAAVVESSRLAIATSGAYARGQHVLDPHRGRPPDGVLSVTIAGTDLATADAYATAAFAMGERGPAWTARLHDYEAMTILAGGRVLSTPGFPSASL
jgi:thiamine biosynthesis lipoprotein